MTRVGVARLKAELSRYLEAAKQGEEVVITDRGRPVAKLVALRGADRAESRRGEGFVCLDARLREAAVREGFLLRPA